MGRMTVIVAGDRRQAEAYARKVGLFQEEWRFVNSIDQVRGMKDFNIVYTGQHYKNKLFYDKAWNDELVMRSNIN